MSTVLGAEGWGAEGGYVHHRTEIVCNVDLCNLPTRAP